MKENNNIWFLIPARAGSKTIPKKNIRNLAGKPLIKYVLDTISKIAEKDQIIVSTDDENVKAIVAKSAIIHNRSERNSDDVTTLDDVAFEVSNFLIENRGAKTRDILITCQPTSPFLSVETLKQVIKIHREKEIDTVLTVVDDRHLRWTIKDGNPMPMYEKRVNRQQMLPVYGETGGVISSSLNQIKQKGTRIGERISILNVEEKEGIDIDTFADWALAEYWASKLKIFIRVDGAKNLGFGHLYRCIAIAQSIHSHDVFFVTRTNNEYSLGVDFLKKHHYPIIEVKSDNEFLSKLSVLNPDIVINDILDTEVEYIRKLKEFGAFVVNFEDLGKGNRLADIVINDLYPDLYPQKNHWYGVKYAILNPNFEMLNTKDSPNKDVNSILIAYGGTDPANLTLKAISALVSINYTKKVTVVIGPGNANFNEIKKEINNIKGEVELLRDVSNMAVLMKNADLALTSAGRTVTELMTIGVPTITMCQNNREMRHNHASSTFGIVNLGFGSSVSVEVLADHIKIFLEDISLRKDMYVRMKNAVMGRSNSEIVNKILETYKNKL